MLHKINLLSNHVSFRLNRHIYYFLLKIQNVSNTATFAPYSQYLQLDFEKKVNRSAPLRIKLNAFFDKFKMLNQSQRDGLIKQFKSIQNIEQVLNDLNFDGNSIKIGSLPESIREETSTLFVYLYKATLLSYKKTEHYELLYKQIKNKICPFCGLEKLNNPDLYNQDYDHILYKGEYALGAINMRNLIPMGSDCNQIYKKTKDVLYDGRLNRRKFLYPYSNSIDISFSLQGSILPLGGIDKGQWNVTINPDNEYTRTWDSVFCISERCKKNELESFFDNWLEVFKSYFKKKSSGWNERLIRIELEHTGISFLENPYDVSNIIKGSLFLFLSKCNNPGFFSALLTDLNATI